MEKSAHIPDRAAKEHMSKGASDIATTTKTPMGMKSVSGVMAETPHIPVRSPKEKVIKSQTNSGGTMKEPKKT